MSAIMLKLLVPVLLVMALPASEGFFGTNMYLLQDLMRMTQTKCGVILDSVKLVCLKSPPPACQTFSELSAFCQDIMGRCTQKFMNPKLCYPPFQGVNPYWKTITPNTFLFIRSFDRNDAQVFEFICRLFCVNKPTALCDVLIWLVAKARRLNGIPGQSSCVSPGFPGSSAATPSTTTAPATTEAATTEAATTEAATTEAATTEAATTEAATTEAATTEAATTEEATTEAATTEATTTEAAATTEAATTEAATTEPPTTEEPCMFDCESACDQEDRKEGSCPGGQICCKKDCCSRFRVM